jgi:hypothetical protein
VTSQRSFQSLLVMRFLLITNGIILAVVGALYVAYGSRPAGYVIGGILGAAALAMWAMVPLTDPYRSERRR